MRRQTGIWGFVEVRQVYRAVLFPGPITLWADPNDPSKGKRRLTTVNAAQAALVYHGFRSYRDTPEWAEASSALRRALEEQTPVSIQEARRAFERLAQLNGALVQAG
jgi:hypothetical protein